MTIIPSGMMEGAASARRQATRTSYGSNLAAIPEERDTCPVSDQILIGAAKAIGLAAGLAWLVIFTRAMPNAMLTYR